MNMKTSKRQAKVYVSDISRKDAIERALAYGVDVSALMMNLKRTPYERIKRHQFALDTFQMLQKAKKIELETIKKLKKN